MSTAPHAPSDPRGFRAALRAGALVLDGAMGTTLHVHGHAYGSCFETLNVDEPELIRGVHRGFLQAGARVLETNTFGANRVRLGALGQPERVGELNRAGVARAREAAEDAAFVAGSVGPTGERCDRLTGREAGRLRDVFVHQCRALLDVGVDTLFLETFRQAEEIRAALAAARAVAGDEFPILAMMSFDERNTIADGRGPADVARMLRDWGAFAVGLNCATGPAHAVEVAVPMLAAGVPVVAVPNAGLPRQIGGRSTYPATPECFRDCARRLFQAGVHAVGGCCGTTPAHVREIAVAARRLSPVVGG